jgi:hypothetical protein
MSVSVIEWDGQTVPEGLRSLPPGQSLVEAMDAAHIEYGTDA